MALLPGHLCIHKVILKFDRAFHPDRLKSVSRLPMPKCDSRAHLVGIKYLSARQWFRDGLGGALAYLPGDAHAIKFHSFKRFHIPGSLVGGRSCSAAETAWGLGYVTLGLRLGSRVRRG